MSTSTKHAIGIDIGGTKIAVALIDGQGRRVDHAVLATEAELGFGRAVERISAAIEQLLQHSNVNDLSGIGIGCAGPVDPLRGLINNHYTLTGWNQCDIVTPLRERFSVPVLLENDADVAAVGECACGAGQGASPVVMLTFGTGVGGAAVLDGKIYRGVKGEHPELGHVPVLTDAKTPCYCGISGCLESIASGTAIALAGKEERYLDTRAVFAAAEAGEAPARLIVARAIGAACTAAWTICHTFLPERLILGGGMMDDHFTLFADSIQERLAKATQFTPAHVAVVRAALGNDAGMLGAGILALEPHRHLPTGV